MDESEHASSLARAVLEQVADAVICSDTAGNIVLWNTAAAALFGYSAAEVVGQSLNLIIPEHLQKGHWRGFEAAMKSGVMRLQGRPTLTRAKHRSGRRLYVEMTFALVRQAEGAPHGAVAVARDVTERVEQQRAAAASGQGTQTS
jgi:PAS domain S-box-containing protein